MRNWVGLGIGRVSMWACFAGSCLIASCGRPPASDAPVAARQAREIPALAATSTPSPRPSAEPVAAPPESAASTTPPAPRKETGFPNWTYNGSDSSSGAIILRCENAFPPEDGSGKCVCEGHELGVCVDGVRQTYIDRKQCGFVCKPTPQDARKIALRCPDAHLPVVAADGCECSGRKAMDPCAGGIASVSAKAGECIVTCKKSQ